MKTQFKADQVKCNGIGGQGYQDALKYKAQIIKICQDVRDSLGEDKIWLEVIKLAKIKNSLDIYGGPRFNSVEDNASRLISGIGQYVSSYIEDPSLMEMHIAAVLNNLTFEEKKIMVLEACLDCASADHWYEFEKEWD